MKTTLDYLKELQALLIVALEKHLYRFVIEIGHINDGNYDMTIWIYVRKTKRSKQHHLTIYSFRDERENDATINEIKKLLK